MSKANTSDPTKRHKSRNHRGISYRVRKDGSRQYSVYFGGTYQGVEGGEAEAVAKQSDLRVRAARGERAVLPSKQTFGEVAELWFESKRKLQPWTRKSYRAALDNVLLPRFGLRKLAAITPEHVAALIRDLEGKGLSSSTIENYLLPLSGTMAFAVRRGLIAVNPCSLLTNDDRPQRRERQQDHVWSDEEIDALIEAAENLARQPTSRYKSRYNYTPLIRTALFTGLRLGELLGLRWEDVDLHEGVLRSDAPWFEPAAKLAEIEGVTFHSMRHAFASRMIDRGISSTVLASLMGHGSSTITERKYIHLFDRQRTDDAVRQAMASTL